MSCTKEIKKEFQTQVKGGMVSADLLKLRPNFLKWKVSTIKSSLSKLKKDGHLKINWRTRSNMNTYDESRASPLRKSACYYKLRGGYNE